MSEPVAFDHLNPTKKQTDPNNVGANKDYPRHLHKFAGVGALNTFIVVNNDIEKAAALKAGWSLEPQSEPPAEVVEVPHRGRKAFAETV